MKKKFLKLELGFLGRKVNLKKKKIINIKFTVKY